jgi:fused signal recognition particle receptor
VARDWSELFITAEGSGPHDADGALDGEAGEGAGDSSGSGRRGLFRRLRESMAKTRQALGSEIQATLFGVLDEHTWERLEEALIMADVGASTTASVVEALEAEAGSGKLEGGEALSERLIALLAETARVGDARIDIRAQPTVIVAVGVNGTGKTTTIGKLAWHLQRELGVSVLLGAADTYRAAAGEQLEGWAERAGCEIVRGAEGSDPGAVAFDAIARARSGGVDVVIIDTAGRLHTQDDLMAELGKVRRVIARQLEGAPHETLLTVDATTGQNGLRQAKRFADTADVTGVVLTKLDGTARGGIALAIARELELPVKLIGVGESLEDLRPFDPEDFARALIAE